MKPNVVMLVVSLSAILSCGPGVPTQNPAPINEAQPVTVADGNKDPLPPVSTVSSAALNPAHGLPGHRCDIAVGQPLNSKPAAGVNSLSTTTTPAAKPATTSSSPFVTPGVKTNTTPSTNVLPTATTPGLNPKHGQPGHRCDILVGQPLNSKPAAAPASPLPAIPTTSIAPSTSTSDVAPGMNPKHGQPGHRCDIAVGQPLNSKPAPGK